ncbi:MAG: 3-oxoacyl-[acyl-carrier-protein] synthase III C-terminal domain-containing protein [Caulobacterales bacterium]
MPEFGITAYGAYVPRLRIDRKIIAEAHKWMAPSLKGLAKGSRAFPSWDEDSITMAVEASRDALVGQGISQLKGLHLASTTAPYSDLQASAIVAGALRAPSQLNSSDSGNSQRAGTSALLQTLKAGDAALIVASDAPVAKAASTQEMTYGAGAAAFTVGSGNVIAKLLGSGSVTDVFVDHFRAADQDYDYFWEERWVRDEGYAKIAPAAIKAALADAKLSIADINHFVMPSLLRAAADAVAKKVKFEGVVAPGLDENVGYAGAAHALLMLANTLESAKPGERILLVGFGQGADALVLEVTPAISALPKRRGVSGCVADAVATDSYLRMLSFYNGIDLEWGMRSEKNAKTQLTEQYRSSEQLEGFVAGECSACGTVQFPQLPKCVKCTAPRSQFKPRPLVDEKAEVLTSTADWLSYYPAPPMYVGFVQFDNGARLIMEMVDVGPAGVDRGAPLRMVYRIKEKDRVRGYNRYFWKTTPVTAG